MSAPADLDDSEPGDVLCECGHASDDHAIALVPWHERRCLANVLRLGDCDCAAFEVAS